LFLTPVSFAAAPGIVGSATGGNPTFNLTAHDAYLNMPDGEAVYSWGYGCNGAPAGFQPTMTGQACPNMQVPGPTMIVTDGQPLRSNLLTGLPPAAGNTSILFPGFQVTTSCSATTQVGQQGLLTCEATPGGTVTYTFTASNPGTHPYYSGTQGDLQVEMGLYGAVIVLPTGGGPSRCHSTNTNLFGKSDYGTANHVQGF